MGLIWGRVARYFSPSSTGVPQAKRSRHAKRARRLTASMDEALAQVQRGKVDGIRMRLAELDPTELTKQLHAKAMVLAAWNDDGETLKKLCQGTERDVLAALCVAAHWASCGAAAVLLRTRDSWSVEFALRHGRRATPLSLAARAGHVAVVRLLVASVGVRYSLADAMRFAVRERHVDVVRVLIEAKASTGEVLADALEEPLDLLEVLLRHKGCPETPSHRDMTTALHEAVECDCVPAAALLLRSKADINLRNGEGCTLLCAAAASSPYEKDQCVQLLLDAKADVEEPSQSGGRPLHFAAHAGNHRAIEVLLAAKANVGARNPTGRTALHVAARTGGGSCVLDALLAARASVHDQTVTGKTPLHIAAIHDQRIQAVTLIAAKADVRTPGILDQVVQCGHTLCLQDMLDAGVVHHVREEQRDLQEDLGALCFTAMDRGYCGVLATLLSAKASCNARASNGDSPLHRVVRRLAPDRDDDTVAFMHLLLQAKADVRAVAADGATPLHHAAAQGICSFVRLLVNAGASVDSDEDADSAPPPLYVAADNGHAPVVRALLGCKARATRTWQGWTPLHTAVVQSFDEVARVLLAHEPALKDVRTVGPRTVEQREFAHNLLPLDLARLLKHDDCIVLLSAPRP